MLSFWRRFSLLLTALAGWTLAAGAPPTSGESWPLAALRPGQRGEVWTVFQGTEPEAFAVQVTGVVGNALGPGKSLIVCELIDPRLRDMGAAAGMSGSPLYIEGRFAGALSYQLQRFETTHYAGFTPAADLAEVGAQPFPASPPPKGAAVDRAPFPAGAASLEAGFRPLQPVVALGGLAPAVADLLAPQLAACGLGTTALGGTMAPVAEAGNVSASAPLRPGSAASVALITGDITLAATGTVSLVEGDRVTAFGHPLLGLGETELPLCRAEIVTILPSALQSVKLANTGATVGTVYQDRLSGISGVLGRQPAMIPVEIGLALPEGRARTLHCQVIRQPQLLPALVAAGVAQSILGSNDGGLRDGFRLRGTLTFPGGEELTTQTLYAGPQAFALALGEFVQNLQASLLNPYEKVFPTRLAFAIEPLTQNPLINLETFLLSRSVIRPGEPLEATLAWRDYQGEARHATVRIPIDPAWAGRQLEVVLAHGRLLDELTGRPRTVTAAQLRSFPAFLNFLRDLRQTDGLYLAVLEKTSVFTDQTVPTPELPGSYERIARTADEARFQRRDTFVPLWETHLLPGRLAYLSVRRPLHVTD